MGTTFSQFAPPPGGECHYIQSPHTGDCNCQCTFERCNFVSNILTGCVSPEAAQQFVPELNARIQRFKNPAFALWGFLLLPMSIIFGAFDVRAEEVQLEHIRLTPRVESARVSTP